MDPKLKAILQKSKQIDQAAKKYDTVDTAVLEGRVNGRTGGSGGSGLYDQLGVDSSSSASVNVLSEEYQDRVTSSGLPPEIQKAMRETPIPQGSALGDFDVSDVKDLNPGAAYSETDEFESMTEERRPTPRPRQKSNTPSPQIVEGDLQKLVAKEIARVLPKVLENYFDKKIIKENTRLMKVLLKSTQSKGRV